MVLTQGAAVWSLAVLADGRLASGGEDGKIKLWPKEGTGEPVVLTHGALVILCGSLLVTCARPRLRARLPEQTDIFVGLVFSRSH